MPLEKAAGEGFAKCLEDSRKLSGDLPRAGRQEPLLRQFEPTLFVGHTFFSSRQQSRRISHRI